MVHSEPGPTVATVVFTDVVGSTARDRRLGPERADALRRSHVADASEIVLRHNGRIVKSLGDGLLSIFAAPSAAIEAAVALQQLSVDLGRGRADPIELRVGISVGEISVDEHGDCFGLAVVEAARLCDGANAGEILVSEMTRRLIASPSHPLRALGPRPLKGLDTAIEVHLVEWRPSTSSRPVDLTHIDADAELRARAAGMLDLIRSDAHIGRIRARLFELLDPQPGQSILDVGSGTGDDVLALREFVGPTGRLVGIDVSATMVQEAKQRASDAGVAAEFLVGDVTSLDIPDATFDSVRCDRVFQYVLEPQRAMRELVRVTRSGGRIVVAETDWESAVLDSPDDDLTARINTAWTDSRPNGRAGHQLFRLARRTGLTDVVVEGFVQVKTDLDVLYAVGVLPALARTAVDAGAVTGEEASRWIASIEHAASEGVFFRAFTTFVVWGQVP